MWVTREEVLFLFFTSRGLHKFYLGVLASCLFLILLMTPGGRVVVLSGRGPQHFQPSLKVFHSFMALAQFLLVSSTYFTLILFKE